MAFFNASKTLDFMRGAIGVKGIYTAGWKTICCLKGFPLIIAMIPSLCRLL